MGIFLVSHLENSRLDTPEGSPQLSRSLQPRHVTMIAIGGIIGAGLFVTSSTAIAATGPAIILSYLIAGGLMILVMRMLGEMAMALPNVRSFTEFARTGLGNWAGFACGWMYWYFWVVVVPVEAIAGAIIVQDWISLPVWQIGLVLLAAMTAVNLMSTRSYGEFEFWFSSIKVSAIIVVILLAGAYAFGLTSPDGATFGNLTRHGGFMPYGFISVLAGVVTVFFSMCGSEITTIAAAESAEPADAIAKMTTSVLARIMLFYVGSIFFIISIVPWNTMKVGFSPFTQAMQLMGFEWAGLAMSVVVLTAVLSCLSSAFYICSRVLFGLAEKGDAPRWLVKVNHRRVPVNSVLLGAFVGVLGLLAAAVSQDFVFALLVNSAGALMLVVYLVVSVAQVRIRRAREKAGTAAPRINMWFFPWASYVAIGGIAAVLVAMALTPGLRRDFQASTVTVVFISLAYLLLKRHRARQVSAARDIAPMSAVAETK
jgi:GABA permease